MGVSRLDPQLSQLAGERHKEGVEEGRARIDVRRQQRAAVAEPQGERGKRGEGGEGLARGCDGLLLLRKRWGVESKKRRRKERVSFFLS